jgi:hypothetical protein
LVYFFVLKQKTCGDKTHYDECSLKKPYFCENGKLVKKASLCGCNEDLNMSVNGNSCASEYKIEPKRVVLEYVLRGEEKTLDFTVYKAMTEHLSSLPRSISYEQGEEPLRADFKLRNINNQEQRELLLPLVVEIQNTAEDEIDQLRIAVSIVQKIPFGSSEKNISFGGAILNYSRYPYEVLYDDEAICGEKSELLAFLLKELGYEVVFFYHSPENHESIGIKCPKPNSLNKNEYCFVETTGSSIITDNELEYVGIGKLYSEPEIIFVSDGKSLGVFLYEYRDARALKRIRSSINGNSGKLNFFQYRKLKKLKTKYDLEEIYYS